MEKGQQILVTDLEDLLAEAKAGEFGDYSNQKYGLPKLELRTRLLKMADKVIAGDYD